jgi:adenylate kinase
MATYCVLLGPPGSGKGTQAKRLAKYLDIPHISSGDLFREMKEADTPLAHEIRQILASGDLVPDDLTVQVVAERLAKADTREKGAILDGFPRTVPQAEALDELLAELGESLDIVLLIDITEDEAVRRISGRRVCPTCGRVYHVEFDPPEVPGHCDVDGTALVQREDDQPAVVRDRYQVYLEKTEPLVDTYRDRGLLATIDGMRPIEDVTPDMVNAVQEAMKS